MPGATTARFVVCAFEMPIKLFMMPQTVPNRPTKGAVAPIVARMPVPRAMPRAGRRLDAFEAGGGPLLDALDRSPSSDKLASANAAWLKRCGRPAVAERPLCFAQRPRPLQPRQRRRAVCACSSQSSTNLASATVQVRTEANESPMITPLTM